MGGRLPLVMIVDDNRDAAESFAVMCELCGAEAVSACSGAEAIEKMKDSLPDIILLDIGLPDINGYEVCRRMRKNPELKDTRIYACSGWSDEDHLRQCAEAGFDSHLVKPVRMEVIKNLIMTD